ncbi:MAG: sulfatase-like hydrolase/transferase [Caldilineaceae bacterium]|nr:sulfatase-like hydrolase/transferase [Caldilineaceae bacterium]
MTTHIKPSGRSRLHPDLVFWGCFLALNALLFLPLYLLNLNEGTAPQILAELRSAPKTALFNLFIWRENTDPFRINSELVLMLALWVNVGWLRRGTTRWIMVFIYFVALFYYLYESIMIYLYRDEPVFYNHYFLIRDGLRFLAEHLNISLLVYFGVLLGAVLLVALIIVILRTLVDWQLPSQLSRTSRLGVTALGVAVLLSALTYRGVSADPRMVMSSLSFKLEKNIAASVALYHSIVNFDDAEIYTTYNYNRHHLAKKPNIYLLFVESYGSVLYKRPDWRVAYMDMLHKAEKELEAGNFHFASNFSISPTWGGGSWLAYTSALFGLHIESHPQYLTLMERYQTKVPRYPDIGTYLRNQGYHYFWTTSISEQLGDKKWNSYKTFYGVDEWLRYDDLDYDGARYGWGPAPPDQYVLAYSRDVAMQDQDKPLVMFYITQNSHFPFQTRPTMVKDWRDLDTPSPTGDPVPEEGVSHAQLRANYLSGIEYELEMLTDFILNHADEDAVFVLVGDHQPPSVSRRSDGYETPVHIISHDPALIANLEQYGFVESLVIPDKPVSDKAADNTDTNDTGTDNTGAAEDQTLHHEGLYSLLVRTLIQTYGERPYDAPPYLPNGVTPPDWIVAQTEEPTQ